MRIVAVLMIFTLTACVSVETRTARQSGVGFDISDTRTIDDG